MRSGYLPFPPTFRGAGRAPVRGGRWSVRRREDGRWRAWSRGKASRFAKTFSTHAEAVAYAQLAASSFVLFGAKKGGEILAEWRRANSSARKLTHNATV